MARTVRQLAAVRLEERLESLHFHPELAFVVDRAARINVVIALGGLEGRGVPFIERLGRLDVVVSVHQDRGLALGMEPVGVDERMAGGVDDLDVVHADAAEFIGDEVGGLRDVAFVLFESADARNAKEIF